MKSLRELLFGKKPVTIPKRLEFPPDLKIAPPQYTPDNWMIQQHAFQNVFIYNDLKSGCSRNNELDSTYCADHRSFGITKSDKFVLMKYVNGSTTAIAIEVEEDMLFQQISKGRVSSYLGDPARVSGQIYSVMPHLLKKLDILHENGVLFQRKRVRVSVSFREKTGRSIGRPQVHDVAAWMYMAKRDVWASKMDSAKQVMSPCPLYTNHDKFNETSKDYYFFKE